MKRITFGLLLLLMTNLFVSHIYSLEHPFTNYQSQDVDEDSPPTNDPDFPLEK